MRFEHVPPSELQIQTLHIRGPDNEVLEGILVKPGSVPDGIPFHTIEFFQTNTRAHCEWLMESKEQHRESQAVERFTLACQSMQQKTMMQKIPKLDAYQVLQQGAREHQQKLELSEAVVAGGPSDVQVQAETKSKSRLEDADGLMAPPPLPKAKGKNNPRNRSGVGKVQQIKVKDEEGRACVVQVQVLDRNFGLLHPHHL